MSVKGKIARLKSKLTVVIEGVLGRKYEIYTGTGSPNTFACRRWCDECAKGTVVVELIDACVFQGASLGIYQLGFCGLVLLLAVPALGIH
jgi:hypothetical protein